jgi:hypothetical protein
VFEISRNLSIQVFGPFEVAGPIPHIEPRPRANAAELVITRVFPMKLRRRGFEMRLIIGGIGAPAPRADRALLRAIARGYQWSDDLLTGRVESVAVLAER